MSLYFTQPIARKAIWGGDRLAQRFGYHYMTNHVGQAWAFSCQEGNESPLQCGGTLGDLWCSQPELFHSRYDCFPFIISLVAPVSDLSIQIHPNDETAQRHGYSTGKNEAWVFLEAPDSGEIVYGQRMLDKAALRAMVMAERWNDIIAHLKVENGDFVYVPSGMLHALSAGCTAYEVQQATDVTYRFFDYHRKDTHGNERVLHVEDAIDCVDFSLGAQNQSPMPRVIETSSALITTYIQCPCFCIRQIKVDGEQTLRFPGYQLMTVSEGAGKANGHEIAVGKNFLLPAGEELRLEGCATIMTTCE